jgi:hypothetical protein
MNKIVIVTAIVMIMSQCSYATENTDIESIEKDLFGVEYKDEQIPARLGRIEKFVFGGEKKGTNQERIKRITDATGLNLEKKKTEEEKKIAEANLIKEDKSVSYPIIDLMEERVFKKNYQGENVYKRVERLEEKTYGKISKGELSERTDKLKASILALNAKQEKIATRNAEKASIPFNRSQNYAKYTNEETNFSFGGKESISRTTGGAANIQEDFRYALASAETMILGRTNLSDTDEERLEKLERKVFNKSYTGGDNLTRLDRVVSAAHAQKTGKTYSESKMDRYISTGLQAGMIILMILAMIL